MLQVNNVYLHKRIENVTLGIKHGECWHLLGNNGAGKSSLLGIMAGSIAPESGSVHYHNHELRSLSIAELAISRCLLQQIPTSEFDISLRELLYFYTQSTTLPAKIESALNLTKLMHKPLRTLSGGQQQRFHIARCLSQIWPCVEEGQALVLLDEPSQHLDVKYQARLMTLLSDIAALGNAVVLSSHNVNQSYQFASHIAWVKNHQVLSSGLVSVEMTPEKLQKAFDQRFTKLEDPKTNTTFFVSVTK